jgi:transmembrane sensor
MRTTRDEFLRDAVTERAADWYLRHREGELTPAEKQEFLRWLQDSLQHTREYLSVARLAGGLREAVSDLRGQEGEGEWPATPAREGASDDVLHLPVIPGRAYGQRGEGNPHRFGRRSQQGTYWKLAGAAACLIVAAAAVYWLTTPGFLGLPRSIAVAHGEQRTVQLRDGSIVHVNSSSRLEVRYSSTERVVELQSGQALFDVARDPDRPFRVRAGNTELVAVGTQFDVYRRGSEDVTVTVVHGKVDVLTSAGIQVSARRESDVSVSRPLRLNAGEQIRLSRQQVLQKPETVDVRIATAWMRRELIIEGRPLGEVASELNRYLAVPIRIEDPSLSRLDVSGVFNAYDADSFIAFLEQYPVEVERGSDAIHVRSAR